MPLIYIPFQGYSPQLDGSHPSLDVVYLQVWHFALKPGFPGNQVFYLSQALKDVCCCSKECCAWQPEPRNFSPSWPITLPARNSPTQTLSSNLQSSRMTLSKSDHRDLESACCQPPYDTRLQLALGYQCSLFEAGRCLLILPPMP